jgi:hypothetical protein
MQGAEPWVFLAERSWSLVTTPSGGCQAPSSTGCCEIRQDTVCPILRGNECEWPVSWSSLRPESRCASFGTRFPFLLSMPKVASTRADSKSSNLPSRSRSSHRSLPYSLMRATKQSSTRLPDSLHREANGFRHARWRAYRSDRVGTTTVPTPVSDCSKAPLRHPTAIRSFSPLVSRHSRAMKFAAIRTAASWPIKRRT